MYEFGENLMKVITKLFLLEGRKKTCLHFLYYLLFFNHLPRSVKWTGRDLETPIFPSRLGMSYRKPAL